LFFFSTRFFLHFRRSRSSGHLRKKKHEKTNEKKNEKICKTKREHRPKKNENKTAAYKCIFVFFLIAFSK
jgi:hypothetical protein